jgi:hypothetical protein
MTEERDDDEEFDASRGRQQSLGDFGVVAEIMARFANQVMGLWAEFTDGRKTQAEVWAELEVLCLEHAGIWRGEDPDFTPAPWRTEATLKGKIVVWVPGITAEGDVIARYFKFLGRQILKGCQEVQDGMALEQAGPMLKVILTDAAEKLAGVQP